MDSARREGLLGAAELFFQRMADDVIVDGYRVTKGSREPTDGAHPHGIDR